jgi:hypothetical protein
MTNNVQDMKQEKLLHREIFLLFQKQMQPSVGAYKRKVWSYLFKTKILKVLILPLIIGSVSHKLLRGFNLLKEDMPTWIGIILVIILLGVLFFLIRYIYQTIQSFFKRVLFQDEVLFEEALGKEYRNLISKPLLNHLKPHCKIEDWFFDDAYNNSQLLPTNYKSYYGILEIKHQKMSVGYIHTASGVNDIRNGLAGAQILQTVFKGMIAYFPCRNAQTEKVFILPNQYEQLVGGLSTQFHSMTDHAGAKLVTMDNPDFEKAFKVYTTDSVQAHYLLSTKWLEKLTDFQKELNVPISIALHSGMCYVALHGYESPLTPQQDLQKALTASGVYTQYIRLKKLFDQLEVLHQIGE